MRMEVSTALVIFFCNAADICMEARGGAIAVVLPWSWFVVNDCPDSDDNKFLALAKAADAELIIGRDPHLTGLHPCCEIPIIPPAAFLTGIR